MKKTAALSVLQQSSQNQEKIVIHPNDGFDLGLLALNSKADIFSGISLEEFQHGKAEFMAGSIFLENDCRQGTIELSPRYWKKIGKPNSVILYYDNGKLLIKT